MKGKPPVAIRLGAFRFRNKLSDDFACPDAELRAAIYCSSRVFNASRYWASALSRNSSALLWTASSIAIFESVASPLACCSNQNACSCAAIAASSASWSDSIEGAGGVSVLFLETPLESSSSPNSFAICLGFVGGRLVA